MKTLTTILTALFLFTLTSFGQNNVIDMTTFWLYDGTTPTSDNFTVAVNPDYPTAIEASGTMIITFDNFIDYTGMTTNDNLLITNLVKMQLDNGAVYGLKFDYATLSDGNVSINYNPDTEFTFITVQDTVNSYNNGIASIDTESFYNDGFTAGVASIDTMVIWDSGYTVGHSDGYDTGYAKGVEDSTTGTKSAFANVKNLNVYPNPVKTSEYVNVECDNFNNVKVLTISGQEVYTSYNTIFPVSEFTNTSGIYVLKVEDNDFNIKVTRLIVK